jgi:nitroreductase
MVKRLNIKFIIFFVFVSVCFAREKTKLPEPNLNDGFLSILSKRKTDREFDPNKDIDSQTLSNILWAANGINRKDGKRTIPTAKDARDMEIYVIKKDGTYLYDAENNSLILITNRNLFHYFTKQKFVEDAPLILLYASKKEEDYSYMHAGSSYQNVAVYCAENGINNVVRGYFDKKGIARELNIKDDDNIIISQVIGYGR